VRHRQPDPTARPRRTPPALGLAFVVALGTLLSPGLATSPARASAVKAPAYDHDGSPHTPGACACETKCTGSCCCVSVRARKAARPPAAPGRPASPARPADSPSGPCLGAAPCGGGASPSSSPTVTHPFDPASLGTPSTAHPDPAVDRVRADASSTAAGRPASPLDEPPEPASR
jgi:hypothetical protein